MADYANTLLDAVSVVVDKKLEQLEYNKTIKATVINADKASKGIYTVKIGSATFDAYSENKGYAVDDIVYVSIPNNNTGEQKMIVGKAFIAEEKSYISTKPFDSFINISNNLITEDVSAGLIANHLSDLKQEVLLWSENYYSHPLSGYGEIGLQAKFKSWLSSYNIAFGNYGLRLDVHTKSKSKELEIYNLYLSNKNMVGNPYNFATFVNQQIVFDISSFSDIVYLELYFYQEGGSFIDTDGDPIPYEENITETVTADLPKNLFVKDVLLALGFNTKELTPGEDYLKLYTNSTTNYTENEIKNIILNWIHWTDEETSVVMNSDSELTYEIRWYQYELNGGDSADTYVNQNWKRIEEDKINAYEINFIPSARNQIEQIQAVIIINTKENEKKIFYSNILQFENIYQVTTPVLTESGLTLTCTDGSEGSYFIYGPGNTLLQPSNANTVRTIEVDFRQGNNKDINIFNDTTVTYEIEWIYDTTNAMFEIVGNPQNSRTLNYKIKDYYSSWQTNNTITCIVSAKENNYRISTSLELMFGTGGTSGTDATLVLGFAENTIIKDGERIPQNAVERGATSAKFKARLFDSSNKIVSPQDYDIVWTIENGGNDIAITPMDNAMVSISKDYGFSMYDSLILVGTINNYGDYPLTAKFPIPVTADIKLYNELQGVTQVIYSTLGYPVAYNIPYNLKAGPTISTLPESTTEYGWRIFYTDVDSIQKFIPAGYTTVPPVGMGMISSNNILQPYVMYVKDALPYAVQAIDPNLGDVFWNQPILTMQNAYPSSTLNSWNGQDVVIDDGSITAPAIAAGKKNDDNTFSGIMIGDWSDTNTDESVTKLTGIYGLSSGIMSYAFKEDGTAFIGKSGVGRINFDGNHGWITSGDFTQRLGTDSNGQDAVYYTTTSFIDLTAQGQPIQYTNNVAVPMMVKFGNNFIITPNGNVYIVGDLTATRLIATESGVIANFNISERWLYSKGTTASIYLGPDGIYLGAPSQNIDETSNTTIYNSLRTYSDFYVSPSGFFKAVNGDIGGWTVSSNSLGKTFTDGSTNTTFALRSSAGSNESTIVQFGPNFLVGSKGTVNLKDCLLKNVLQVRGAINGFHKIVYQTYKYTIAKNKYYKSCSGTVTSPGWKAVCFMNIYSGNKYVRITGYGINPDTGKWTIQLSKYPYTTKVQTTLSFAILFLKATSQTVSTLPEINKVQNDGDAYDPESNRGDSQTGKPNDQLAVDNFVDLDGGAVPSAQDSYTAEIEDSDGEDSLSFVVGSQTAGINIADYATNAYVNSTFAPLNSPQLAGTPTTPNLVANSVGGQIANKNYVDTVIGNLAQEISGHNYIVPSTLNNYATKQYVDDANTPSNTALKNKINEIIAAAGLTGVDQLS